MINTPIITPSGTRTNAGTSLAVPPPPSTPSGATVLVAEKLTPDNALSVEVVLAAPLSTAEGMADSGMDVGAPPLDERCSKQRQALEIDSGEKGAM